MTMRNKPIQSMGVVTKTTVIKTDEENSRMKSKQQRDDSKQHRTAERTATTKSKQQQPVDDEANIDADIRRVESSLNEIEKLLPE